MFPLLYLEAATAWPSKNVFGFHLCKSQSAGRAPVLRREHVDFASHAREGISVFVHDVEDGLSLRWRCRVVLPEGNDAFLWDRHRVCAESSLGNTAVKPAARVPRWGSSRRIC